MNRPLFAFALAAVPWTAALSQTIEAPRAQSGQTSVNVGPGGQQQGAGGSVSSGLNKAGATSIQLKGSVDGYTAPSVRLDQDRAPDAGPALAPGAVPTGLPSGPSDAAAPQSVRRPGAEVQPAFKAAPQASAMPGAVQGRLPLNDAAPAAEGLEETVTDLKKAAKEGGVMGSAAAETALNKIFEGARQAANKSADSAELGSVVGAMVKVETKIRRTVSVANTSSPHDAPGLYRSAIETAKESLPSSTSEAVARAVLASADRKAETALPELANETVAHAQAGSAKGVDRGLQSFSRWESLLGKPGRPLVGNLSHLKNFVQSIFGGFSGAGVSASRQAAAGGTQSGAVVVSGGVSKVSASAARPAFSNRIWFRRDSRTRTFEAILPGSAVTPVPDLALSFSLASVRASLAPEGDAYAAFLAEPTAANGFGIIYRSLRGSGSGRARSFLAAASFWAKTVLTRAFRGLASLLRRPVSAERASALVAEEAAEYAAVQNILARQTGAVSAASAREALRRAGRMASLYEQLSGDPGGVGAVKDVAVRLSGYGLDSGGFLSAEAGRLVTGTDGASLATWVERVHSAMTAGAPSRGASALEAFSPSVIAGGPPAAQAALERLLFDVESRTDAAAAAASVLASIDPSPARFMDLGRVGGMLGQGMSLRLKDGRVVVLTILRDAELGRIAFARAEAGSFKSLSAKELAAVLRAE
ncbi:MAG: hypothetical protein WC943_08080 [Elusimicrobiota bacterium]